MILGSKKAEIDALLGKPVMSKNLLGLPGEKAWAYTLGDFSVIVGFLHETARYLAVKRRNGPGNSFSPAELGGVLALNAPASQWTLEKPDSPAKKVADPKRKTKIEVEPTTYFSFVEKDPKNKEKVLREIRGWMPGSKPHAFFYLPSIEGGQPLLVSEWAVDQKLG